MIIENVVVEADETVFSKDELKKYVKHVKITTDGVLKKIRIKRRTDGGFDVEFKADVDFEEIADPMEI